MLVSVLMSVYNSDKYLEEAIQSILNQSYRDFEFLIVDDGSTDKSESIIKKYAALDKRIVFVKNEANLGLAGSLNKGIQLAKGKYIARQDADDASALNRLEQQVNYALGHPEVDLIGSNCYIIDINGSIVYEDKTYSSKKDIFFNLMNFMAIFPHGSVLMKKDKLVEVGLYDTRFYYSQDGELWLRLISHKAIVHTMEQSLYYYRSAPRAFDKKYIAQCMYNKVKQMIYAEKTDPETIEKELDKIKIHITEGDPLSRPFYMADYWKGLANGAYLNNGKVSISYQYILKALKEKNSFWNYPNYLAMSFIYILPPSLIKRIFKIEQGTHPMKI